MSNLVWLALVTVVPFGLVILVVYKMLTRKKCPEIKLVEATAEEVKVAEKAVKEVLAKAKKINKTKAQKGKRRVKKN
jgi:hypothetical protein